LEEEKIKSALEIAMERISGLPELTPEEIAEQKEKEYRPLGEALCQRFVGGIIGEEELRAALGRNEGEKGKIIRRACVRCLCRSVQIDDGPQSEKAIRGLASVSGESSGFWKKIGSHVRQLRYEFEQAKQTASGRYETLAREQLEKSGISGSSVKPNIAEDENWLEELRGIRENYDQKLAGMREEVLRRISG
jgi:hypothetical protein